MCLTPTVLCAHGVSIVTGPTDLAVPPAGVAQTSQTLPGDSVTVPRPAEVHVAIALAADAGPAHHLRVTVKTAGTPADTRTEGRVLGVARCLPTGWMGAGPRRHLSQVRPAYPSRQRSQDTWPEASSAHVGLKLLDSSVRGHGHRRQSPGVPSVASP